MLDTAMRGGAKRNDAADAFGRRPFALGGEALLLDMSGALYWPARRTLVVADLHFEKGSSYAKRGQFLPPYDTRETLCRLAPVLARYEADTVISLGDSLHDRSAHERLAPDDLAQLRELQKERKWIWVLGNHDPEIGDCLGGEVTDAVRIGEVVLRHEPSASDAEYEIAGHLHPAAKLLQHGCSIRRPCFIGTAGRLVLPAFGAYTGGLNVLDPAFATLFTGAEDIGVWMLGHEGLYPVPMTLLRAD